MLNAFAFPSTSRLVIRIACFSLTDISANCEHICETIRGFGTARFPGIPQCAPRWLTRGLEPRVAQTEHRDDTREGGRAGEAAYTIGKRTAMANVSHAR